MKEVEQKIPTKDFTQTEHSCPVCGMKMFTEPTPSGVVLWCGYNIPQPDGCHCKEVVAYGKDLKSAAATMKEKFARAIEGRRKNQ